jgi:hypothetical protein
MGPNDYGVAEEISLKSHIDNRNVHPIDFFINREETGSLQWAQRDLSFLTITSPELDQILPSRFKKKSC